MTIKSSVYIATSLDGFIARPDGNLDWLDEAGNLVPKGEDLGYERFMQTVDVMVMGRRHSKRYYHSAAGTLANGALSS